MKKGKKAQLPSDDGSDLGGAGDDLEEGDVKKKDNSKQSNTIIQ